jgi:hypothetical protein
MTSKEEEVKALEETLKKREAGVTDLLEFYASIEAVYAASIKALEEERTAMSSNATNCGR